MKFTYDSYEKLINSIIERGYQITDYHTSKDTDLPCILRHDVDMSLEKAAELAEIESKIGVNGVKTTYFVLLSSDFYNPFSKASIQYMKQIQSFGHEIGLHFDEKKYIREGNCEQTNIDEYLIKEVSMLSQILEVPVTVASMHRPSTRFLNSKIEFFGKKMQIINSYAPVFFEKFKYLSDSRMNWREDVELVVETSAYNALHILTHPYWYSREEKNIKKILTEFILDAKQERYITLNDNLRDLDKIVLLEEMQ